MSGIPTETFEFLEGLSENNNKPWFEAHREAYQSDLLDPLQDFIASLGSRLQTKFPDVTYDTRPNGQGTLSRIYRDVRFSKDKSPYRTHLWGVFSAKSAHMHGKPTFGFSVGPDGVLLMTGVWMFPKEMLQTYRDAVADPKSGGKLDAVLKPLRAAGYTVGGEHYKKVPAGYDPTHPRADLLRHAGLYVFTPTISPADADNDDLVDRCFKQYAESAPLNAWLGKIHES